MQSVKIILLNNSNFGARSYSKDSKFSKYAQHIRDVEKSRFLNLQFIWREKKKLKQLRGQLSNIVRQIVSHYFGAQSK